MKKFLFSSIVIVSLFLGACGENDAVLPSPETNSAETAEYRSAEEIKKDVEIFQEALSISDRSKCEDIKGADLRSRCLERVKEIPQ